MNKKDLDVIAKMARKMREIEQLCIAMSQEGWIELCESMAEEETIVWPEFTGLKDTLMCIHWQPSHPMTK